jgi:hypothetical protein
MVFKARYTQEYYAPGATRIKRTFAWLPFKINGDMVWLEYYETKQLYAVNVYPALNEEGKEKGYQVFNWIDLSHRIITR